MEGQQRFPHKYIKRVKKDGKWVYVYADDAAKTWKQATAGSEEHVVVIAHGRPTLIHADPQTSHITSGPPQIVGKRLFLNTNPNKLYYGIARSDDQSGDPVYLYSEETLQRAAAKKAAKIQKSRQASQLIDATSERLMHNMNPINKQYGLAMWLNNKTKLRIGAHTTAASVDAKERRAIINKAKQEGWSEVDKKLALQAARTPTFGLLTLQAGHVNLNHDNHVVTFAFRGKGGKMITNDTVSVKLPQLQYYTLTYLMHDKEPSDRLFPDVVYKSVLRYYSKYGITPHTVRGGFADSEIREMISAYKSEKPNESPTATWNRFNRDVKENISDKLGHSLDMTKKAYVTDDTRSALDKFKEYLWQRKLQESDKSDGVEALANVMTWIEIGPGNVVI